MCKNIDQVIGGKSRHSKTNFMSAIKDDLGNTIRHEKSIADQLNKRFVKVGPNLWNNFPPGTNR